MSEESERSELRVIVRVVFEVNVGVGVEVGPVSSRMRLYVGELVLVGGGGLDWTEALITGLLSRLSNNYLCSLSSHRQ